MPHKIYETKKNIEVDLAKKNEFTQKKEAQVARINAQIDEKKKKIDQLYDNKSRDMKMIRSLIKEGKQKQQKRDELQQSLKPILRKIKQNKKQIEGCADKIKKLKGVRKDLNKEAKGSNAFLANTLSGQFYTLLLKESVLKRELELFQMFFDMRDRTLASEKSIKIHREVESTYMLLKDLEKQNRTMLKKYRKIRKMADQEHQSAIDKFKQKDKLSKKLSNFFDEIDPLKKEINDLYLTLQAVTRVQTRLKQDKQYLYDQKSRLVGERVRLNRREKIKLAKQKMDNEEKMGLEDLKILLTSGRLNLSSGKKKGKKRQR